MIASIVKKKVVGGVAPPIVCWKSTANVGV